MRTVIIIIVLLLSLASCRQGERGLAVRAPRERLVVAFYNLENLWDPADDTLNPGDDDFTPGGEMHWTVDRMERKLAGIARAVRSIDDMRGPDLIGMCEMENRDVLERLAGEYLPRGEYRVVHAESHDHRGIDVALLYRPSSMRLTGMALHRVDLGGGESPTRDIMEARFSKDGRSFTVLVNHWPSRLGGVEESSPRREAAARVAARIIDSLTALDRNADIILMGDLNDEPSDRSVAEVLDARGYTGERFTHRLINTAAPVERSDTIGSYYFRDDWETIDQIMLAPAGALDGRGITFYGASETVFAPLFLRDARADPVALPPYHTYTRGTLYIGGTSDHFPVYLEVGWERGD